MTYSNSTIRLQPAPFKKIPHYIMEKIIEQECIWGLRHPEGGWALCPSCLDIDRDVYLFWSDRRRAFSSVQLEWAEFEPVAIGLHEFIPSWLEDMISNDTRLGLDWDPGTEGPEYDAQAFKRRICYRLNKLKKII